MLLIPAMNRAGAVSNGVVVKSQGNVYQQNEVNTGQFKGANIANSTEKTYMRCREPSTAMQCGTR